MQIQEQAAIVGWDIGGAHVKASLLQNNELKHVLQVPCPLWKGLDQLELALSKIMQAFNLETADALHAITMTGELVDLFANRKEGVIAIANALEKKLGQHCWYYQCQREQDPFIRFHEIETYWPAIASANWHASAQLMAQGVHDGMLIDIGSTTTDVIIMHDGQVQTTGDTDATRLRSGEMVYTGVIRTPLMALGPYVDWLTKQQPLVAEYFATTADVYRLLEELPSLHDMTEPADGGEKTIKASAIRLARMVGHDVEDEPICNWVALAQAFKCKQVSLIVTSVIKQLMVLKRVATNVETISIVSAGVGSFLAKEIIAVLNESGHYPTMQLTQSQKMLSKLLNQIGISITLPQQDWAGNCLPATSVAILAYQTNNP